MANFFCSVFFFRAFGGGEFPPLSFEFPPQTITNFVCFLDVLHIFLSPQKKFPLKTTSLEKTLLLLSCGVRTYVGPNILLIMSLPFYLSFLLPPLSFLPFPSCSSSTLPSSSFLSLFPSPPPKICKVTLASSAEPSARHGAQAESCHGQPCQGSQSGCLFQTTTW